MSKRELNLRDPSWNLQSQVPMVFRIQTISSTKDATCEKTSYPNRTAKHTTHTLNNSYLISSHERVEISHERVIFTTKKLADSDNWEKRQDFERTMRAHR